MPSYKSWASVKGQIPRLDLLSMVFPFALVLKNSVFPLSLHCVTFSKSALKKTPYIKASLLKSDKIKIT